MGRPCKLTPAVHDGIVAARRTGASLQAAARSQGLNPGTVSRWLSAGRVAYEAAGLEGSGELSDEELASLVGDDKVAFVKLYRALLEAEVEPAIEGAIMLMARIENGHWRDARLWLRRCGADPSPESRDRPLPPVTRTAGRSPSAGGRPTKLTDRVHHEIVRLVGLGVFRSDAAAAVEISAATFRRWMQTGEAWYEHGGRLVDALYADDPDGDDLPGIPSPEDLAEVLEPEELRLAMFYRDVSRAEAMVEMRVAQAWFKAAQHDWRAAQAWLEWRFPERWTLEGSAAWHQREQAEAELEQAEREARHRGAAGRSDAEHPVDRADRLTIESILRELADAGRSPDVRVDA